MKVDLNGLTDPALDGVKSPQRSPSESTATSATNSEATVGDAATLSVDSARVNSLVAKALDTSAIRQDRVEVLRHAVQNGEYEVDPAQIAEAMIRQPG